MNVHKLIIIFFKFLNLVMCEHNSFMNECGPYLGHLPDKENMPNLNDCIKSTNNALTEKCCFVQAQKGYENITTCILIEDTSENRIELIEELSEIGTKIKVNCGSEKLLVSDCGTENPNSPGDCISDSSGDEKCCYIKISSDEYSGVSCKKFKNQDLKNIEEVDSAAKSVDTKLQIQCSSSNKTLYFFRYIVFGIIILYFLIWIGFFVAKFWKKCTKEKKF